MGGDKHDILLWVWILLAKSRVIGVYIFWTLIVQVLENQFPPKQEGRCLWHLLWLILFREIFFIWTQISLSGEYYPLLRRLFSSLLWFLVNKLPLIKRHHIYTYTDGPKVIGQVSNIMYDPLPHWPGEVQ